MSPIDERSEPSSSTYNQLSKLFIKEHETYMLIQGFIKLSF